MEKLEKYVVLSLDPMYSPLHSKIAALVGKEKKRHAILSCWAKKVYLRGFQCTLATQLINGITEKCVTKEIRKRVEHLTTYHHAYVKKVEKRTLSNDEITYMARFYQALVHFLERESIDLVLVHNDVRWYHAIAIDICKRKGIRYLVTEQGLIRPHTTVIDNRGVNANANLGFSSSKPQQPAKLSNDFRPTIYHDSWISIVFFAVFLLIFTIERTIGSGTIIRYMHNKYSLRKYAQRFYNRINNRKNKIDSTHVPNQYVLLLLQLDTDSQILVHSDFSNNQEIISQVEENILPLGYHLAIKQHPLDQKDYKTSNGTLWVDGNIQQLASSAQCVISVNSSSAISVLETKTPLFLIGQSIYNYPGVAEYSRVNDIPEKLAKINITQHTKMRSAYLRHLKYRYLVAVTGWSLTPAIILNKLQNLLHDPNLRTISRGNKVPEKQDNITLAKTKNTDNTYENA
ncbi:capsular polysaccharide export protein, LipB/KpsS family [Salinivibrio kushneri]|uniref:capsular polysaccharide export protein, LipB/KpsS family n=1 Tax=Salinivibrio kushneri TaxID=1908198 RepID=UPI000C8394FB|nr:phosphoribosylamine--glycine ligase [Salinivibrio kushneri]